MRPPAILNPRKAARIAALGVAAEGKSFARSRSMAKTSKTKGFEKLKDPEKHHVAGPGGATHHTAGATQGPVTANQGVVVADNQNTLKSGERGPSLLEVFVFPEKITHFDHEPIPERIVHARGSGAHGYFTVTNPIPDSTRASFLAEKGKKTAVFAPSLALLLDWIRGALGHLKVIGYTAAGQPLFAKAGIADDPDQVVIELDPRASIGRYIEVANQQRVWAREACPSESGA
jgi:hypothetical protein